MNRQNIAQEAVCEMGKIIQKLTLDNVEEIEGELSTYFHFIKSLAALKVSVSHELEPCSKKNVEHIQLKETDEKAKQINCYEFKRLLKGGIIEEINLYVPENIIRKQQFEDGDLISAVHLGNEKFHFELIEKGKNRKQTNRIQLNYCVLSNRDSMLVASEYLDNDGKIKSIKYNDAPHTFLINEDTRTREDLEIGSIVDIAYYSDNVDVFKVIWKHNTDEIKHAAPSPSSYYKTKNPKLDTTTITNELNGKKVLVLGGTRTSEFEKAITSVGGELIHAYGNENTKRLESMVKSCDMLITMKLNINHPTAEKAKEFAKKYEKPFTLTDSRGISSLVQTAKSLVLE
ncbi:DUF2325 domain-containing protein [Bacillus sp. IS1]|uniref:DUF2325 domain-containing protein n=1 Tax=Bacillus TaxID=1386 RepID=UPI0028FA47F9|nr:MULTISPECIES: DUF2325 domain-containing protein [unclassified Bacillus (in: firmicutes)]MDU0078332.1 DUF2325 domain-containing protein [Bacillus sp. IG2]MDU0104039.1 DUF2325 domain-containing protein [Bacillus sp. IS1]